MADKKSLEITVDGKPVPADKAARVLQNLKEALRDQLEKEALNPNKGLLGDVSSHARW
jgi:hypothetical protein